ncbi:MAG TPA: nucleotide-binding domain containing protein, partial [Beijerinckiaceae bacterium]
IAASAERRTLAQTGFARLHVPVLDLASMDDVARALDRATPLLSEEEPVVIAASPELAKAAALPVMLAALAEDLAARGVGRLLVAGEACFGAMLDRLGGPALRIGPEIAAATPWCAAGETGLQLAFKPGMAGGRDILLRAFLEA